MSGLNRFLMNEVEMPLVPVIAVLEDNGYLIDVGYFDELHQRLVRELDQVNHQIQTFRLDEATGNRVSGTVEQVVRNFNPKSSAQVSKLLYEVLGLPVLNTTSHNKPSSNNESLKQLRQQSALIPLILRHRELSKLVSTYCHLPDKIDADGRLRVEFQQLGAQTGRITSSSIIQTIPRDDRSGIRRGFVAARGHKIVAADFEQQELRWLAQVSDDIALRSAILDGIDLHGLAAVRIFDLDCSANEVKRKFPEKRNQIKATQFGIIYGRGPGSLASELDLTVEEAQQLIEDYYHQFPSVQRFVNDVHERVVRDGYIDDLFGRRRYLPDARLQRPKRKWARMSANEKDVVRRINKAKREAQNFVIQGACATITKLAMIRCHQHIQAEHPDIKMILSLHDELQFEVPEDLVDHFAGELPGLMCNLGLERFNVTIPMRAEVKVGPNWGELTPWTSRDGDSNDNEHQ